VGKKEKEIARVVLDTNVLISALLFRGGLSKIRDLWKTGKIIPVLSRETFEEFKRVLEYPKFRLSKDEIRAIIEDEVLPYFEVVEVTRKVTGVCKDPDDDKFLACAVSAGVKIIVSGDPHLLNLSRYGRVRIIRGDDLLRSITL